MADTEALVNGLNECAEKLDFDGAFKIVRENQADLAKKLSPAGVKDALKKTTKDRLLLAFLDGVEFGLKPLEKSLLMLEKLLAFNANVPGERGALVINDTWGVGTVKKLDYFYKRITVDFKTKKGHQFTFAAACDMLEPAPKDHILVLRQVAPADYETLLKEHPGEFLKKVIVSNGSSMTLIMLETFCEKHGLVKEINWKAYWDKARVELKKDACVVIPLRKTDPIEVKSAAEDYGDSWLTNFCHETDPKAILSSEREYVAEGKFKTSDEATKARIGERLLFAVTAAKMTDDALYARIACEITAHGFTNPPADEMRAYLWDRKRYIKAAATLPAREVGAMIAFLACDDAAKEKLYKAIPEFCFTAVQEVVSRFGGEGPCRTYIGHYLRQAKCPATLTTLVAGKYEQFKEWAELPKLSLILGHVIALGEGRQGGETLKMQNIIRRLFGDKNWLKKIFDWLTPEEQSMFFERFQASIAWDPSTHHATVMRMTNLVPELKSHVVVVEKKKEYARITSYRSFGLKKAEYLKLINEDMPANVKRIEFAKSYGDLSENAEYQYAKDEQRALMQKQTLMQADLEAVKPGDFADATTDEVMPGVTVVCETKTGEKVWTILGEWDNDLDKGIISSKTKVATNLMGKKVGDDFELPDAEGNLTFATVKEIRPLSDDIKAWMALPAGIQI